MDGMELIWLPLGLTNYQCLMPEKHLKEKHNLGRRDVMPANVFRGEQIRK